MDREILFRGKKIDGSGWMIGQLYYSENKAWITDSRNVNLSTHNLAWFEVKPETVGQFTGLLDKNRKKIFEGNYDSAFDVVTWCDKRKGWSMTIYDFPTKRFIECHCLQCAGDFDITDFESCLEIIGTIHDNPELIGKEASHA